MTWVVCSQFIDVQLHGFQPSGSLISHPASVMLTFSEVSSSILIKSLHFSSQYHLLWASYICVEALEKTDNYDICDGLNGFLSSSELTSMFLWKALKSPIIRGEWLPSLSSLFMIPLYCSMYWIPLPVGSLLPCPPSSMPWTKEPSLWCWWVIWVVLMVWKLTNTAWNQLLLSWRSCLESEHQGWYHKVALCDKFKLYFVI